MPGMMRNFTLTALLLLPLLVSRPADAGDLYKCIGTDGSTTYQDMPCGPGQVRETIEGRYANVLSMRLSARDKRLAKEFDAAERQEQRRRRKWLGDQIRKFTEKRKRCKALSAKYLHWQSARRLNLRPKPDAERDIVSRMRAACST